MSEVSADFARSLVRELEGFKRELAQFPDDEAVWKTTAGITNSAGNLALHLAGNLQYFIGSVLGGTGYVRNRELEFGRRSGSRDEIYRELDAAIAVVHRVLPAIPEDTLAAEFPEPVMGLNSGRARFSCTSARTPAFISVRPATFGASSWATRHRAARFPLGRWRCDCFD